MEDESDDLYLFEAPPSSTPSTCSSTDEEEEVPLNQQTPRIAETNSVAGDWSRSSRDLNGNDGVYDPSTSQWRDRPGTDGSSTDSDGNHSMETTDGGDSSSLLQRAIEVAQRWSPTLQSANEETSTVQRSDWGEPLHFVFGMEPRETVEALIVRSEAFIQELLRSLFLSRSDYPPIPGRLPVSISPESSSPSIQLKINLKNRTSSIVQGRDIPPRFRNDRNKGLPTMDVSADSIQGAFNQACDHFSFWLTRLITMIDDENEGDEAIKPEDYYPTFELFQKEFLDFDEMVTFALKRLRPLVALDVIETLNERHKDIQNKYWKLEVAVLTGKFKDQEGYISDVADDIENVLRSLWSIYTTY